jgi:transposase-like protein
MARPSKATPERIEMLKAWLAAGMSLKAAARLVDIDPRTLHRWIRRGFRGDGEAFVAVRAVVHEARREAGVDVVRTPAGLRLRRRYGRPLTPKQLARMFDEQSELAGNKENR